MHIQVSLISATSCLSHLTFYWTCMRYHIQRGEPPSNCAQAVIDSVCNSTNTLTISPEQRKYLEQKLYDGYFGFEATTERNWDNGVCGVCGVAPVLMSGDGNSKNCTPLKRNQVLNPSQNMCVSLLPCS